MAVKNLSNIPSLAISRLVYIHIAITLIAEHNSNYLGSGSI